MAYMGRLKLSTLPSTATNDGHLIISSSAGIPTIRLDRPVLRLAPCLESQLASTLQDMQRSQRGVLSSHTFMWGITRFTRIRGDSQR